MFSMVWRARHSIEWSSTCRSRGAAVGPTTAALTAGGIICCYLPTIPQVQQTVDALRSSGFGMIETLEGLVRTWKIEGQSVRPDHRMVAHTGFLITARKLSD